MAEVDPEISSFVGELLLLDQLAPRPYNDPAITFTARLEPFAVTDTPLLIYLNAPNISLT